MLTATMLPQRYAPIRKLGSGGAATAFLCRDTLLDLDVTLKLLENDGTAPAEALRREFSLLTGLRHPHLVEALDFGRSVSEPGPRRYFYTARYLPGVSLAEFARVRRWPDVARPLVQALSALAFLHRSGVRHGDVKLENIIVSPQGSGTLIDLSCAERVGQDDGRISGTPGALAPELLDGRGEERSDLYALGTTLLRLGELLSDGLPAEVASLARALLQPNVTSRPSDTEAVIATLSSNTEPLAPPLPLPHVLVGRDELLASFGTLLRALGEGHELPRALHFWGPDGIGRSRLLSEIKWRAQLELDVVVASATRVVPLAPFVGAAAEASTPVTPAAMLAAAEGLSQAPHPTLLLLDDLHLLSPADQAALLTFVRSLAPSGRAALVTAGPSALQRSSVLVQQHELRPLTLPQTRAWLGTLIPTPVIGAVQRASGGRPAEIARLARAHLRDGLGVADLQRGTPRDVLETTRKTLVGRLPALQQQALGVVAACGGRTDQTALRAIDEGALAQLVSTQWLQWDGSDVVLVYRSDWATIANALGPTAMQSLHRRLAQIDERQIQAWSGCHSAAQAKQLSQHLLHVAGSGHQAKAELLLQRHATAARRWPTAFRSLADTLAPSSRSAATLLSLAKIYEALGEHHRALATIARCLRLRPDRTTRAQTHLLAGTCYARMGTPRPAQRQLRRALFWADDAQARLEATHQLALVLIKSGACAEALTLADESLLVASTDTTDELLRCDLWCDVALSAAHLGQNERGHDALGKAAAIQQRWPADADARTGRVRARLAAAEAMLAYRQGDGVTAQRSYRHCKELAELHELDDLVVVGSMNYGTVCQQLGEWGEALSAYEAGLRMARGLGLASQSARLLFNLATLQQDLGNTLHAERHAKQAIALAGEHDLPLLGATAELVLAEAALAREDHTGSQRHLDSARQALVLLGATRELADAELVAARLALAQGETEQAEATVSRAIEGATSTGADDLQARGGLLLGRILLATGRAIEALPLLERSLQTAERVGQRLLIAEVETELARACAARGAPQLAASYHQRAQTSYERLAATLPDALGRIFRERVTTSASPVSHLPDAKAPHGSASDWKRLVEINRRLNSIAKPSDILREAIDTAVAITGAERGFLILAERSDVGLRLEVPVARNLDREQVDRPQLKFSRGIAEQVVRTAEVLVAADAAHDARLEGSRSVHAMRLKSVLCVPIRAEELVLGAIYVDNRFRPSGFSQHEIELLIALADQAGIALTKARLLERLAQKANELQAQREEVERLMRAQAQELSQLKQRLEPREETQLIHAYPEIAGRSPPMQTALALLDRVTDSDVTVLIRGESGTGKELAARALHHNGPRKKGNFVAVNCSALPEGLLEAELFGHERGAFTGATVSRPGLFVTANGGTLFLDELGEMPLAMQAKLLRALQERKVKPVGASESVELDVRVVCATNADLRSAVAAGRFRQDLYYRVAVVEVVMPPLRERVEDLPQLTERILARVARDLGRRPAELDGAALRLLAQHAWPGNVRELENALTKAALLCNEGVIRPQDLPLSASGTRRRKRVQPDREQIVAALRAGRTAANAAALLGISRATLYRHLAQHGLDLASARGETEGQH